MSSLLYLAFKPNLFMFFGVYLRLGLMPASDRSTPMFFLKFKFRLPTIFLAFLGSKGSSIEVRFMLGLVL